MKLSIQGNYHAILIQIQKQEPRNRMKRVIQRKIPISEDECNPWLPGKWGKENDVEIVPNIRIRTVFSCS